MDNISKRLIFGINSVDPKFLFINFCVELLCIVFVKVCMRRFGSVIGKNDP